MCGISINKTYLSANSDDWIIIILNNALILWFPHILNNVLILWFPQRLNNALILWFPYRLPLFNTLYGKYILFVNLRSLKTLKSVWIIFWDWLVLKNTKIYSTAEVKIIKRTERRNIYPSFIFKRFYLVILYYYRCFWQDSYIFPVCYKGLHLKILSIMMKSL